MRARIIPKADMKKSPEELKAERLLSQLTDDKAIEVMTRGAVGTNYPPRLHQGCYQSRYGNPSPDQRRPGARYAERRDN